MSWFFLLERTSPGIHLPGVFLLVFGVFLSVFLVTRALSVFRQKIRDAIYLWLDFTAFDYVDNYNSDKLRTNHPQISAG